LVGVPIGRDRAGESYSAVKFIVCVSGELLIVACRGHNRRLASRSKGQTATQKANVSSRNLKPNSNLNCINAVRDVRPVFGVWA
jgi:hypothetical protein